MQKIIIEIAEDASVSVEGHGFKGPECKQLTAAIEEAIGTVEKVTFKPEYRQAAPAKRVRA